ncbi:MAG: GNAT family N-acetyltransferase [Neisseria sp.]|nr:GNAT family N-acetyltransferase [Neisseria sp.]
MLPPHPLHNLFAARHIAVIGASQREGSLGCRVFSALLQSPFQGRLTPVNPRHKTVAGLQAYVQIGQVGEAVDAAVVLTHPESYGGIASACIRLGIPDILILLDPRRMSEGQEGKLSSLIAETEGRIRLTVCGLDGFNLPDKGLYANACGIIPPQGDTAVVGCRHGFCADVLGWLDGLAGGYSFTACPLHGFSPAEPWLDLFREDGGAGSLLIAQYLPQNPPSFYSSLRLAARQKNVILHTGGCLNARERRIMQGIAGHCGAFPTFTPAELRAAVRAARLPRRDNPDSLHILSDGEDGWLHAKAAESGIKTTPLPELSRADNALTLRDAAVRALKRPDCRALLVQVADNAERAAQLEQVRRQSDTPLYYVSRFSDGLPVFPGPEEALNTVAAQTAWQRLKKNRQTSATPPLLPEPPPPDCVRIRQAASVEQLLSALGLPPLSDEKQLSDGLLHYQIHPDSGALLEAEYQGRKKLLLPPFNTLHARQLCRFFDQRKLQSALEQLLYGLNAAAYLAPPLHKLTLKLDIGAAALSAHSAEYRPGSPLVPPLFAAAPISESLPFVTKKQNRLLIRPLLPEDAENLQNFVRNLSDVDRKSRFMNAVKELPPAQLAQFSRIDYAREAALIACTEEDNVIAGWAQHSCLRFPYACEFGISVAGEMQGQGLAKHLMERLIHLAAGQGYRLMYAEILADNPAMLGLAQRLGFTLHPLAEDAGLRAASLPLNPGTAAVPGGDGE